MSKNALPATLTAEFGIILPQKATCLRSEIGKHLEDLPGYANRCVADRLTHADRLDERIAEYDRCKRHYRVRQGAQ